LSIEEHYTKDDTPWFNALDNLTFKESVTGLRLTQLIESRIRTNDPSGYDPVLAKYYPRILAFTSKTKYACRQRLFIPGLSQLVIATTYSMIELVVCATPARIC
jgi:hypothetical protein